MLVLPRFPGEARKNDGIFMYGAQRPKPYVYVYQQESLEIVIGPSCKPELELNLKNCIADSVPIQKRRGGGGTVILAPGVVVTIVVGERKAGESALDIFDKIHSAMITLLENEGIHSIEKKGISDLAIENRKVLGSSLYMGLSPFFYYYQSSLLVSADISLMNRYLEHPPKEPDYRKGRGHETFCTTFDEQGITISPGRICELFTVRLPQVINGRSDPTKLRNLVSAAN
jgi:lipoate-protein ligase A